MTEWPTEVCFICGAATGQKFYAGALRTFDCGTACLEQGEYFQGTRCVEPSDERPEEQHQASDSGDMEGGPARASCKKIEGRQQAGLRKPRKTVRKRHGT